MSKEIGLPNLSEELDKALEENHRLRDENDALRAAWGNSDKPCLYCDLSAQDLARCQLGFPGCGRADDMIMCPHFAAELSVQEDLEKAYLALSKIKSLDLDRHDELLILEIINSVLPENYSEPKSNNLSDSLDL